MTQEADFLRDVTAQLDVACAERDYYKTEWESLRDWLMQTVGSASTLPSAKRVVERLVQDALERNRPYPDTSDPRRAW